MKNWQDEDRRMLFSIAEDFDEYITSPLIEWKSRSSRLLVTPGRVLLSLKRLSVIVPSDAQTSRLLVTVREKISSKAILWERKITQEIPRRLRIWSNLLGDFVEDGLDKSYAVQVENRVMLRLLEQETRTLPNRYQSELEVADAKLRMLIRPGAFAWDIQLIPVFSKEEYWYLYTAEEKGASDAHIL